MMVGRVAALSLVEKSLSPKKSGPLHLQPQLYKPADGVWMDFAVRRRLSRAAERVVHNFTACRINQAGVLLYGAALRLRYAWKQYYADRPSRFRLHRVPRAL